MRRPLRPVVVQAWHYSQYVRQWPYASCTLIYACAAGKSWQALADRRLAGSVRCWGGVVVHFTRAERTAFKLYALCFGAALSASFLVCTRIYILYRVIIVSGEACCMQGQLGSTRTTDGAMRQDRERDPLCMLVAPTVSPTVAKGVTAALWTCTGYGNNEGPVLFR